MGLMEIIIHKGQKLQKIGPIEIKKGKMAFLYR